MKIFHATLSRRRIFLILLIFHIILLVAIYRRLKLEIVDDTINMLVKPLKLSQKIAVVVIACSRTSVVRCLQSIVDADNYSNPIFDYYVSHGCDHKETRESILNFKGAFKYINFPEYKNKDTEEILNIIHLGYKKLNHHYKEMLKFMFDVKKYSKIIIIEDDLDISIDFFNYFLTMEKLFEIDATLFCVSAWNDNGSKKYAKDPYKFMRTNLFPGLGWMTTRQIWDEIKDKWPDSYWDDWMRTKSIIKNRSCIIPQISRLFNFGMVGVSGGDFYKQYIKVVVKNTHKVFYSKVNIQDLIPQNYDKSFLKAFYNSTLVKVKDLKKLKFAGNNRDNYSVGFSNWEEFKRLAVYLSIPPVVNYDVTRTSYYNIVQLQLEKYSLFLYPTFLPIPPLNQNYN